MCNSFSIGSNLVYKGLIGKPSEITYRHGEHVLQCEAMKMGIGNRVSSILIKWKEFPKFLLYNILIIGDSWIP